MTPKMLRSLWLALCLCAAAVADDPALTLVDDTGAAAAVIVIPEEAYPIAEYAAEELAYHVEKATGARLAIVTETAAEEDGRARVYVGATDAARAAGLAPEEIPSERYVVRTIDGALYIAGQDGPGDPLSLGNVYSGTLWGVYELLERQLGVRWLWPGPLGEVVPERDAAHLPALDIEGGPQLMQRHLRPGLGPTGFATAHEKLAFTPEKREEYAHNQSVFLRRHRMGRTANTFFSEPSFGSGHAFESWWERYGEDHPEWFQQLPDGRRGPEDPDRPWRVSMCVSNPGLAQEVVRRWEEERAKNPDQRLHIGIGENDFGARCVCGDCLAWDAPQPDPAELPDGLERSYTPMQASDRYARFAAAVYDLAKETDPDVRLHMYAFENYFWAPSPGIEVPENVMVGFVPWFRWAGWFPRARAEHEWIKEQWMGWQEAGASVHYRPNWFLDGYAMPLVYMRQFADMFQFVQRNGVTATDFDSLQGQWAAQGPNLYLLARMHVRPEAPVDGLLEEYYQAFGPAADHVRAYFSYWEAYAIANRERAADSIRTRRGGHFRRYALYALVADELYPLEVFEPARKILDEAALAVSEDAAPRYRHRVEFLRTGLEHAVKCVETAMVMNDPGSTASERRAALEALAGHRRGVDDVNVANMDRAGIIEADSWQDLDGYFE